MSDAANIPPKGEISDEELAGVLSAHQVWLDTDGSDGSPADLREVVDLGGGRLAGANLTGVKLPPRQDFRELEHVNQTVAIARPLYLALLITCIYTILTVFSTDDRSLITNSPLQIIPETAIGVPVLSFYITVPILIFSFYIYVHLYLYRLWQIVGDLPSIFEDGTPLDRAISPWLPTALVRFYQSHGVEEPSYIGLSQKWVTIFLIWWAAPLTLVLFWARFLVRHDWAGTSLHIFIVSVAFWSAVLLHEIATQAIKGFPIPKRTLRFVIVNASRIFLFGVVFFLLSLGIIEGDARKASLTNPKTWLPRAIHAVGFSPVPVLSRIEFEINEKNFSNADLKGAVFVGSNLQSAQFDGSDLRRVDFTETNLRNSSFKYADLRHATLWKADVAGANLSNSVLRRANLSSANLQAAVFRRADLGRANLHGANLANSDFSNANLRRSDISDSDLSGSIFRGANLRDSDLALANLEGADFFGENLQGADLLGAKFDNVNLLKAKGLQQDQLDQACGANVSGLPHGLTIKPCPKDVSSSDS